MTAQPEPDHAPAPSSAGHGPAITAVRDATGFAWTCRKPVIEDRQPVGQHAVLDGDRREFERHMRAHGLKAPKSSYRRWKPWKAPKPREYAPKPLDPGQPVEWDADGVTRTGVIWGHADRPSSWWAQPDDAPASPVLVQKARGSTDERLHEITGAAEEARANLIRGNIVRERGIRPVIQARTDPAPGGSDRRTWLHLQWHCDPACPRADGKEPYDPASRPADSHILYGATSEDGRPWTPLAVARVLALDLRSGWNREWPRELCPDCITGPPVDFPAPGPRPRPVPASEPDAVPGPVSDPGPPVSPALAADNPAVMPEPAIASSPACPVPGHHRPARFALRLEPPATDEEFLGSCAVIGAALAALAGEVAAWADGLGSLHFPASVTGPLGQAAGAIGDAGAGAGLAAAAFEDEFTGARGVAARGLRITGQDTA